MQFRTPHSAFRIEMDCTLKTEQWQTMIERRNEEYFSSTNQTQECRKTNKGFSETIKQISLKGNFNFIFFC